MTTALASRYSWSPTQKAKYRRFTNKLKKEGYLHLHDKVLADDYILYMKEMKFQYLTLFIRQGVYEIKF